MEVCKVFDGRRKMTRIEKKLGKDHFSAEQYRGINLGVVNIIIKEELWEGATDLDVLKYVRRNPELVYESYRTVGLNEREVRRTYGNLINRLGSRVSDYVEMKKTKKKLGCVTVGNRMEITRRKYLR